MHVTERGRVVLEYAERIFATGRELVEGMRRGISSVPSEVTVGVADVVPKLVTHELLRSSLGGAVAGTVHVREGHPEQLLASLAIRELDMVITDAPIPAWIRVDSRNHLLGECGVTAFAAPREARKLRARFPQSLDGAPVLLPARATTLANELAGWFRALGIEPRVVGRFDDSALLKVFGEAGAGVFFGASAVARHIERQYAVSAIGDVPLRERYYALTTPEPANERLLRQVRAEAARLFLPRQPKRATNP